MKVIRFGLVLLACAAAAAQQREIGILAGGGWAVGLPVQGAPASTSAGLRPGVAAGAFLSHDLYRHWSGEIRYLFALRSLQVTSGGETASFSGQTHVLHYDLVYQARPVGERVRAYVAVGGGMKIFRGTGAEAAYQPLMQYAWLTRAQELKPMLTLGGGMKFRLGRRMVLRIDIRDQITRFPRKMVTPAAGMKLDGWLHDLVPVAGLGWLF